MGINIAEMEEIVICKHCGDPEYYGDMISLSGKTMCRKCYRKLFQELYNSTPFEIPNNTPTVAQYKHQLYMLDREDRMVDINTNNISIGDLDKLFLRDIHLDVNRFIHIEDGNLRMEVLI